MGGKEQRNNRKQVLRKQKILEENLKKKLDKRKWQELNLRKNNISKTITKEAEKDRNMENHKLYMLKKQARAANNNNNTRIKEKGMEIKIRDVKDKEVLT